MTDTTSWSKRLRDDRGRRVIFLAHCLLNENTRYLGGARREGAVREIIDPCLEHGIGIIQLPCPEEHAWGGVLKRWLLLFYGSKGTVRYRLREVLLPVFVWHTKRIYRRLARTTADQILDYEKCGVRVLGIIGVDGSPSCGVRKTLDLRAGLEGVARIARNTSTSEDVNRIVSSVIIPGEGLYVELLRKELDRRGLRVSMTAHDLITELEGKPSSVNIEALIGRES